MPPIPASALVSVSLLGGYLLVIPALTYFYLNLRWYTAGSIERLLMYFFVFFFFPGLLLLSPFLNFRPQPRQIS
jgi:NAD(P)H-quinone oxidoreductase subunit L